MKKAEYPSKTCREPVFSDTGLGYWCELRDQHTGPHASFSSVASVQRRDTWEKENPDLVDKSTLDGGDIIIEPNRKK